MKTASITATYVDHMGTDLSVVNAARVSFERESSWEDGTVTILRHDDERLLAYLAKHEHWSPFAHTTVSFRVKAPIFVARQLVKHQVGGVWNEVSRRYVDSEPEFFMPDVWRGRPDGSIKQGSGESTVTHVDHGYYTYELSKLVSDTLAGLAALYETMVSQGVAPEQARMVLPQNTMTEWIWTGSLIFWDRVCRLRLDGHAQAETRVVAEQINEVCSQLFPYAWKALRGRYQPTAV